MFILGSFIGTYIIILHVTNAFPIEKKQVNDKEESKDEKRYPNGTVEGKYIYKDKEGNPIHVRYYADESSYGVELKSLKVFDNKLPDLPQNKPIFDYQSKTVPPFNISTDSLLPYKNLKFGKNLEILNDKKPKSDHRSEYEIYTENELKPEKCSNERVRVYYEKDNKRKIRNAFDPYDTFRFCEQF